MAGILDAYMPVQSGWKPQPVSFAKTSQTIRNVSNAMPFGPARSAAGSGVLGSSTARANTSSNSISSGGNSNNNNNSSNSVRSAQEEADRQTGRVRDEISSGWDDYISGLDAQLGGLDNQRSSQEQIVNSQYNQGVGSLGLQRDQGLQTLDANRRAAMDNQASSLRDISSNIRNAFQAGNVYLGARGAGDSSAANQYSYALNKMGTQQRSGVMNNTANILSDVDARETNLNNIYNTEVNSLSEQRNQQIQQVAQWFSEAQNQIKQMKNEGRLNKSQDISALSKDLLNRALSEVDRIKALSDNRKQALDQWAMGVSENIGQLRSNMSGVSNVSYDMPTAQGIGGAPTVDSAGNMYTNFGGGGGLFNKERDKNSLF